MSGKAVIGADEMVGKLRAAVAARRDPDLVIIARTDAVAVAAWTRRSPVPGAAAAGADMLFVEAPTSEEDIATVAGELRDAAPLVFNWAEGGRTPPLPLARIAELGFALVIFRSARCWRRPPGSGRCWMGCGRTASRGWPGCRRSTSSPT